MSLPTTWMLSKVVVVKEYLLKTAIQAVKKGVVKSGCPTQDGRVKKL